MTAWNDEFTPPNLAALGQQVRAALGLNPDAIGTKGDEFHTFGYHRSRQWILTDPGSDYGPDDYSVTSDLDQGGDQNWICALDITPSSVEQMIAISKRLDTAMRGDQLPDVREFYGNVDGDQVVDGWDDLTHRAATSDSSHLWHVHLSFYRSRADNDHSDVLDVILGKPTKQDPAPQPLHEEDDDMAVERLVKAGFMYDLTSGEVVTWGVETKFPYDSGKGRGGAGVYLSFVAARSEAAEVDVELIVQVGTGIGGRWVRLDPIVVHPAAPGRNSVQLPPLDATSGYSISIGRVRRKGTPPEAADAEVLYTIKG